MSDFVALYGLAIATNLVFQTNAPLFEPELKHYGLGVATPIRGGELRQFTYNLDDRTFMLTLTNGWHLSFNYGRLTSFESPVGSNPKRGSVHVTNCVLAEVEALELAKGFVRRTGLPDRQSQLHLDPEVSSPRMPGHPFYTFNWHVPNEWMGGACTVRIDCRDRSIVSASFFSLYGHLVREDSAKRPQETPSHPWPPSPSPEPGVEGRLLLTICGELRRWAPDGGYPTGWVDEEKLRGRVKWRFKDPAAPEQWWHAIVNHTNELGGDWAFVFRNGRLTGWNPPDAYFYRRDAAVEDFTGVWRMTERQACDLVRRQVRKMGFPGRKLAFLREKPNSVQKPRLFGERYIVPRIRLLWEDESGLKVEAEVDADARRIKRLVIYLPEPDDPYHFQ